METFKIEGSDKRHELIACGDKYESQAIGGVDIEYFSKQTGFVLLRKLRTYSTDNLGIQRAIACAKLSQGAKLELREFYYTIRSTPDLVKAFAGTQNIYGAVLGSINDLEILCDVPREEFTMGNLPKGFFFYGFSRRYGDSQRKVGMTENLIRSVVDPTDVNSALTVLHIEKNAAATRLVELDFSKLANCIIETTGGNYTRAVDESIRRFKDDHYYITFNDGDSFGYDMHRTARFGSENQRHLENKFPDILVAGLFPSVGAEIKLENDVEEKRPQSNESAMRRIEFLKKFDLVDDRDYHTWVEENKTYELEALSTHFKNRKGDPIGLALYLTEFWRLKKIPLKPQPDDLDNELETEKQRLIDNAVSVNTGGQTCIRDEYYKMLNETFEKLDAEIASKIKNEIETKVSKYLKNQDKDAIISQLLKQYNENPKLERYSISRVLDKHIKIDIAIEIPEEIDDIIKEKMEELRDAINEKLAKATYEVEIDSDDIERVEIEDQYDVVQKTVGSKPDDVKRVREALARRLK